MKRMCLLLWLAVCWFALPALVMAQDDDLPFGISLPPSLNFATSPNPVGSGARAQGKAVAYIAVADDATAASHNPGALIQLERPEFSIVGSFFSRNELQSVTQPEVVLDDQRLDSFDLNYMSFAYPFQIWRRNIVVSLNFQRLFDLRSATDVASRYTTPEIDGIQRVNSRQIGQLFTISPAIAVQITPTFSIGVALNFWPNLFNNGWEQDVAVRGDGRLSPGSNQIVPFVATGNIKEKYSFRGFNATAGFLWSINSVFSVGGVVRTPFTAKLTRDHSSFLTFALQDGESEPVTTRLKFRETLDMDMPISYGMGVSARLSDAITISLDVSRTHWSAFRLEESTQDDTLLVENGAPSGKGQAVLNGESDDTTSVRLGMEYLWLLERMVIAFRTGGFYDPEPGANGVDDVFGFSVGSGVGFARFTFDVAFTYRTGVIQAEATDTTVHQYGLLASIIYYF